MSPATDHWTCPVCAGRTSTPAFRCRTKATEGGVDATMFRPASDAFGSTVGVVVRCVRCRHGSLDSTLDGSAIASAYEEAEDPVSLREEAGQVATAHRDLDALEQALRIGRDTPRGRLLDVGCWTGSFLVAARERGWEPTGIEPSAWAAGRARERGIDVHQCAFGDDGFDGGEFLAAVACDVLEHLTEPAKAVARLSQLVEPGGALFVTVPDAGSRLARTLGARWWSVLPMHVQYFTRHSLTRLLAQNGFEVVSVSTHAKLSSRRYYLERLGSFLPLVGGRVDRLAARLRSGSRLVGPDFHDRIAVIAVRTPDPVG